MMWCRAASNWPRLCATLHAVPRGHQTSSSVPDELRVTVLNTEDPGKLADAIAANLNLPTRRKAGPARNADVRLRLSLLGTLLNRELEVLQLGSEIQNKVSSALSKTQREYFLREQLQADSKGTRRDRRRRHGNQRASPAHRCREHAARREESGR